MGLLRAFDLDFVMTSEQEWGCYATLPASRSTSCPRARASTPSESPVDLERPRGALDASAVPGARAPDPPGRDGDGLAS